MSASEDRIPYRFDRTHDAADVVAAWSSLGPGDESGVTVGVAGRLMLSRPQGKLAFAELRDASGSVQLFALASSPRTSTGSSELNLGDWIGATGEVVRTKRGELSVKVASWELLAEARRNFGDKWHGVTDTEIRYRQREVDLWANERSRAAARCAATSCAACASGCGTGASWRWRRRCSTPSPAGPRRGRSSPTTTPSTSTCTCAWRPSCTSSGWWSAASTRCSRSGAASATRASRPGTTPSSRRSSCTRRTPTTTTRWSCSRSWWPAWRSTCVGPRS